MKFIILSGICMIATMTVMGQQPSVKDSLSAKKVQLKNIAANHEARKQKEKQNTGLRTDRSRQIADRMSESLRLSQSQRADIININIGLEQQKALAFRSDTSRVNVARELQQIEQQRDNMYRAVLTAEQFGIYEKSKLKLINPISSK